MESRISDYVTAIRNKQDVRELLLGAKSGDELVTARGSSKVLHQSSKTHTTRDTEDSQKERCQFPELVGWDLGRKSHFSHPSLTYLIRPVIVSAVEPDGKIITETRTTKEHEEVHDEQLPDDVDGVDEEETKKESSHHFQKTKNEELVEYLADGVKIGEEMRYQAENTEGDRQGNPEMGNWDSLSTRIRKMRRQGGRTTTRGIRSPGDGTTPVTPLDRKDALTKKPLDFDQEEETRKVETSKWLENHFGSDSRSSKDSLDDEEDSATPIAGGKTSFINVTMKSRPITGILNRTPSPAVNGNVVTPPKGYVTNSSRVFVSSPESEEHLASAGSNGFFQGVSEWSERRNDAVLQTKEVKNTFSVPPPSVVTPHRPERVQVLPTGPNHVFRTKTEGVRFSSGSNNSLERVTPPYNSRVVTEHLASASPVSKTEHSMSYHKMDSGTNQDYDKRSPYQQNHTQDNFPIYARDSQPHWSARQRSPTRGVYQNSSSELSREFQEEESNHRLLGSQKSLPVKGYDEENNVYPASRGQSPPSRMRGAAEEESLPSRRGHLPTQKRNYVERFELEDGYRLTPRRWPDNATPTGEHSHDSEPEDPEPPPDYSPPPEPSPSPPTGNKKVYQRTRFAADIPPLQRHAATPSPPHKPPSTTSIIGQSFRRFVDRFRSSSSERRKNGKRRSGGGGKKKGESSRSPSPRQGSSTYQQYHVIDNNIPCLEPGEGGESSQPVPPPRSARAGPQQQSLARNRDAHTHGRTYSQKRQTDRQTDECRERAYKRELTFQDEEQEMMDRGGIHHENRVVQKFYLGEDPFGGSIYGREREYDGVVPVKSRRHRHPSRGTAIHDEEVDVSSKFNSSLGRLSKSTSRLVTEERHHSPAPVDYTRTAQTLPRKLLYEKKYQQHRAAAPPLGNKTPHSSSLINVSIVNHVTPPSGPAKPARTYRSNLARSKSFNVHASSEPPLPSSVYKSNPQLHRLDESPPPLKSPGILASISRSQRDLTREEIHDNRHSRVIGNGTPQGTKKRMFMKGLMDRAPELFKTLHGDEEIVDMRRESRSPSGRLITSTPLKNSRVVDYSNSFRSSSTNANPSEDPYKRSSPYRFSKINGVDGLSSPVGNHSSSYGSSLSHSSSFRDNNGTTTSVVRKGSPGKNDYSETVRITSKSDDPIRPSVTNTVQSFTKKTIPTKGGKSTETIESSETTTVTKSKGRFRGEEEHINGMRYLDSPSSKYTMGNGGGGVVIEVRPTRR
uniref:Uncharacterized protein n=1 Tax=Timema cristinae TaxID=61476 RepID=A0A7R9H045_TIMCR|nr:unnamed protein product [Timema cristinae]